MTIDPNSAPAGTTRGPLIAGGLFLVVVLGVAALYGIKGTSRNGQMADAGAPSCSAAKRVAEKLEPVARGEVAALKISTAPKPAVNVAFSSHDGKPLTLADFRGKTVLLNLWATWCAPCRAEMPALDRLQQELGGADFEVVSVNIDTNRLERPRAFLAEVGVKKLSYYSDQSGAIFADLKKAGKAFGMPTTLLIDKAGCELGVMAGPAEWASPDALYLIRTALGK